METDIVIVGGGPAGLSAAKSAALQGLDVILLEKSTEIGYPIHTSGGSWIKELVDLGINEKFFHPIKRFRFLSPNEEALFSYEEPLACVLDIRGLYQHLAEEASENGAKIFVSTNVREPIIEDGYIKGVRASGIENDIEIRAKITIDASGFSSVIAKKVGLHSGFKRYGNGAEYDLYAPNCDQDEALLLVGTQVAPSGYGWVFPYGNKRVRVGVGLIYPDSKENPKKYLNKLVNEFPDVCEIFKGTSQIEYHHGIVPSEELIENCVSNGLIVVGDSAGLINLLVGEGIRHALILGKVAGEAASQSIYSKDYSEEFLRIKYARITDKLKGKSKINLEINKHISHYTDEKWDEKVRFLSKLTSDQFADFMKGELSLSWVKDVMVNNPSVAKSTIKYLASTAMSSYHRLTR